ncbi:MAG: HAD family phosphatase [Firmicutes bacterium]|nr:HAD family phosphatase [Bacillota bacterium]
MNIIFDIGNVLLSYQPREYLEELFCDQDIVELYHEMIFRSSLWLDLDRGVVNEAEGVEILGNRYPKHKADIQRVFARWYSLLYPIQETTALLPKLKAEGLGLYALSNFHKEAFAYVRTKYKWFDLFDGMIISYAINYIKPEPEIYKALIEKYGLEPAECVFIDDISTNLQAAADLGFQTIEFTSYKNLISELEKLLGESL